MTTWLQDLLFGPEDGDESQLSKALTFQATDPLNHEAVDTTSEFARAHSPEFAEALNESFLTHSLEPVRKFCREPLQKTFAKRVTLNRDHYAKAMRRWIANGESLRTFITGSDASIQEELLRIAEEEGIV